MADNMYKISVIGTFGVGKTTYVKRIIDKHSSFDPKYTATLGIDIVTLIIDSNYGNITFQLYDTAGQEKFSGLGSDYCLNSDGVIAMFDTSSLYSFKQCTKFIDEFYKVNPFSVPLVFCGNKTDNIKDHVSLANKYIVLPAVEDFYRCNISVKTKKNIDQPLLFLARKLTGHADLIFSL